MSSPQCFVLLGGRALTQYFQAARWSPVCRSQGSEVKSGPDLYPAQRVGTRRRSTAVRIQVSADALNSRVKTKVFQGGERAEIAPRARGWRGQPSFHPRRRETPARRGSGREGPSRGPCGSPSPRAIL